MFSKLPNSKIIISESLFERLMLLIGRSAWEPSEHMCIFYGKEIGNNVVYFDKVNEAEDYVNKGTGSKNPLDYSVGPGAGQLNLELEKNIKELPRGAIIADIHTHPSNVIVGEDINEYRYFSNGDIEANLKWRNLITPYNLIHISGLISVDRINGNMSISFIWYDAINRKFCIFEDVVLDKINSNGTHEYLSFSKVGDVQLIFQNWGLDLPLSKIVSDELKKL